MIVLLRVLLAAGLMSSCGADSGLSSDDSGSEGGGQDGAGEGAGKVAGVRGNFSITVLAESDLPTCNEFSEDLLVFVRESTTFKYCDAGSWVPVDLTPKEEHKESRIVASIFCSGGLENTTLGFNYSAALMSSGDVFATGGIAGGLFVISASSFYSYQQKGAATASIFLTNDFAGAANGGFWTISLDRQTLVTTIVYKDSDIAGGEDSWTMPASKCVSNSYEEEE